MTNLFIDIETIPGQNPAVMSQIMEDMEAEKVEVKAPANYKDLGKIAEYISAKLAEIEAQFDERWRKTSLDGTRGEIVCISWAFDDGPIQHHWRDYQSESEAVMLKRFYNDIGSDCRPCFIGHNVLGFDLRFIYQRSVILNVRPTITLPHDARGNGPYLFDTMLAWAGWGNRISLDKVCRALGVARKGTEPGEPMDGSMVWDRVQAGRIQDVVTYCDADVERVRQIYNRMTFNDDVPHYVTGRIECF